MHATQTIVANKTGITAALGRLGSRQTSLHQSWLDVVHTPPMATAVLLPTFLSIGNTLPHSGTSEASEFCLQGGAAIPVVVF